MKKSGVLLLFLALLVVNIALAQVPQWVVPAGSSGPDDIGIVCKSAPNGTIVVAGQYSGTMDIDPSTSTYNLVSYNNSQDVFLACYSTSGNLLWGFSIGRSDLDGVNALTIDNAGNIYIGGYFRDGNLDFDPGGGTATIPYAGNTNGLTWGGDGFIAKYSSTGSYQWAYSFGSASGREAIDGIAVDNSNNIIVSGVFKDSIDVDHSGASYFLNANNKGTVFVAKYNASMQFQWAFNTGKPGFNVDNSIRTVKTDAGGNIYICGFVQNDTALDFDPSSGVAHFTVNGLLDGFVAKYTPAGAYSFAFLIGGSGVDDFLDMDLDTANNIYVTGYSTTNSVDFDPSSATAFATIAGGGNDIMLASYTSSGQYRWGKLIGDLGDDIAWRMDVTNNSVYVTGYFNSTVNFNPGGMQTASLAGNGNIDMFVSRYTLTGLYRCCFNAGSTSTDRGSGISVDANGQVYVTGAFSGTNTDFDPTGGVLTKSSNGSTDMFLARYDWPITPLGYLVGDTVCAGEQAYLTYIDTLTGSPSATIMYTDGTNTYSANVTNGVPFALSPNPTTTKKYALFIPTGLCWQGGNVDTARVIVNARPNANAGTDTAVCSIPSIQLNGSGGGTYSWQSSQPIANATSATPTVPGNVNATYRLVVTNTVGCTDTDEVDVLSLPVPVANAGNDTVACAGDAVLLHGSGGATYLWYSSLPVTNAASATPLVQAQTGTVYLVATSASNCSDTDEIMITAVPYPIAYAGNDTAICLETELELKGNVTGTSAVTHSWHSVYNIPDPTLLNIKVKPAFPTLFFLVAVDSAGCSDSASIMVSLIQKPAFSVSPLTDTICMGELTELTATGGGSYNWSADNFSASTSKISVNPQSNTSYSVIIMGPECGYSDTFQVPVVVQSQPEVSVSASNNISCSSPSTTLTASGAAEYNWLPTSGLNTGHGNNIVAKPKETTEYTVTGIAATGCRDTAKVTVNVTHDGESDILIPNAFSPDGNGLNDCFKVKANFDYESYYIQIRNRWGDIVYTSNNIMDCWDGTHKSKDSENRTYYYFVEIKTAKCGSLFRKGDVTIVR